MASGNGYEVAKAFVTIVPTMEGSQKSITEQLTGVTSSASESAGATSGKKFGESLANGLKTTGTIIAGALATATAGAVAMTKGFIDATNSVSELGNEIGKESAKLNLSTTSYQEWDFVLTHAGASIEGLKTSMKKLTVASVEGSDAFAQLGISEEQLASMSPEETFNATITALQGVEDEATRTALANDLLGKGAVELAPLFNMTAEETEALKQQVHDLGGVLSEDAVRDAEAYQDALQDMETSMNGLKNNLVSKFLPGVTKAMNGLAKVFSGDKSGIGEIQTGIEEVISNVSALMPEFMELGASIITSLLSGVAPMLPSIVSTIFDVLIQAIVVLTGMIPQLMPSIISGIQGICSALFEALPVIIQGISALLMSLVTWLSDGENVRNFVNGIIQLVSLLADQFSQLLPVLLPALLTIVSELALALTDPQNVLILVQAVIQVAVAIFEALVNCVPVLINFVIGLFDNLGSLMGMFLDWASDGVAKGLEGIVNFVKGIGNKIKNGISNFWTNTKNNFTNGINIIKSFVTNGLNAVKEKFTSIFETVKNTVKNGIEKIKSFFHFDWELPSLKMPHFNISGSFSLNPPRVPSFSVSWYAKAMEEPIMLNGATIFGASNGQLLGGGEVGSEVVIGTDKLLDMMSDAVGVNGSPITINVYATENQSVDDLADRIAEKLEDMTRRRGVIYA